MSNGPEMTPTGPIDEDVLQGLFDSHNQPSHDEKWKELDSSDAAFARHALVRADEIRHQPPADVGLAYLAGVADLHAAIVRQRAISEAETVFDADAGLKELTEKSTEE